MKRILRKTKIEKTPEQKEEEKIHYILRVLANNTDNLNLLPKKYQAWFDYFIDDFNYDESLIDAFVVYFKKGMLDRQTKKEDIIKAIKYLNSIVPPDSYDPSYLYIENILPLYCINPSNHEVGGAGNRIIRNDNAKEIWNRNKAAAPSPFHKDLRDWMAKGWEKQFKNEKFQSTLDFLMKKAPTIPVTLYRFESGRRDDEKFIKFHNRSFSAGKSFSNAAVKGGDYIMGYDEVIEKWKKIVNKESCQ